MPKIAALHAEYGDFRPDAYNFVIQAVEFTVDRLPEARHVNARELLSGLREYAHNEYGPLADNVLRDWGIRDGRDIGILVYRLIDVQLLGANPDDRPGDFDCNFELFTPPKPAGQRNFCAPLID